MCVGQFRKTKDRDDKQVALLGANGSIYLLDNFIVTSFLYLDSYGSHFRTFPFL